MTKQSIIEAELRGEVSTPTNELGIVTRFTALSDEEVAKAFQNGSLGFVASMTNTTPMALMERRARALGRRNTAEKRIPTITRLAQMTDEQLNATPAKDLGFLATLLGITPVQLIARRMAQRLVLGLDKKPVKAKAEKAPVAKATKAPAKKAKKTTRTQVELDALPDFEAQAALEADFEASIGVED